MRTCRKLFRKTKQVDFEHKAGQGQECEMGPCRNLFCKLTDSVFCSGDYDDDDDDDGSPVALFVLSTAAP